MEEVPNIDFAQVDAVAHALEPTLRYTVAVTALASANTPRLIAPLVKRCEGVLSDDGNISFVLKSRESLLKMIATIGAPRVINAMGVLMESINERVREALPKEPFRTKEESDYDFVRQRGMALWSGVYSRQAEKLEKKLGGWYPDLIEVIQADLYGRLLSNTKVLDAKSTELCTIGALAPIDVPSQLKSHVLGAGRFGATPEEIEGARALAELMATAKK
ncbi:hypothetical protein GQ54DRAFT_298802 [Martensiomyces pterosporus]|nr:hypothetical protein GQ54DRAFT_298802 [Martensiomyces pterosporus]